MGFIELQNSKINFPDKYAEIRIQILLNQEFPKVTISGTPPKHGKNSFSKLHFQWQKQAGSQDELGNTDLKNLNTFPTVQKDELVATIYKSTQGIPGVNALGKIITPLNGKELSLKLDPETVREQEDPSDPENIIHLYATKSGIADFKLSNKDNPKTLKSLNITDTITIKGDIDYSVGDLSDDNLGGEAINIVVYGDVRGAFSLKSKGFIIVKGTIDGQKVIAKNIQVNVITAGSQAIAYDQLVAGTVIKAKIRGRVVTLKRASNDSEIIGKEQVILDKGTNCLSLIIKTREFYSESGNFSGRSFVVIGQDLFDEEQRILQEFESNTKVLLMSKQEITEIGESVLFNFRQLKVGVVQGCPSASPKSRELLDFIQEEIEHCLQKMDRPLNPELTNHCLALLKSIGNKEQAAELLPKIKTLIPPLQKLDNALQHHCEILKKIEEKDSLIEKLRLEVEQLSAKFEDIKFLTDNSEVVVRFGKQELILNPKKKKESPIELAYELTAETGISEGRIVFEESFQFASNKDFFPTYNPKHANQPRKFNGLFQTKPLILCYFHYPR